MKDPHTEANSQFPTPNIQLPTPNFQLPTSSSQPAPSSSTPLLHFVPILQTMSSSSGGISYPPSPIYNNLKLIPICPSATALSLPKPRLLTHPPSTTSAALFTTSSSSASPPSASPSPPQYSRPPTSNSPFPYGLISTPSGHTPPKTHKTSPFLSFNHMS